MKANRKLKEDKNGFVGMEYIIGSILVLVISAVAITIVYPMFGGIPMTAIDNQIRANNQADLWRGTDGLAVGGTWNQTYVANATSAAVTTTGTVMDLNPMMALVFIAAGIIVVLLSAFSGAGKQTL